jgi:DUF971 family protein
LKRFTTVFSLEPTQLGLMPSHSGGLLHSRRGISEVLASLTLLLVIVSVATIFYSYSLTTMDSQRIALSSKVQAESDQAQERFRIISLLWPGSGDSLSVVVLNYGKLDIKVTDVYVQGRKVVSYSEGHDEEIYTSEWERIEFTSPAPISAGNEYELVVVSERGVSHAYVWES